MGKRNASNARVLPRSMAVVIGLVLSVAACGSPRGQTSQLVSGSWDDVVVAAEREGAVTIYSSQVTDQLQALKTAFEQEYPRIKLLFVRGGSDEGIPKVEAEARTGRGIADVLVTASLSWATTHKDLSEAPRGPAFDTDVYNRSVNIPEGSYFIISAVVLTFGWNTQLYPEGIRDWPDLFDPKLQGGRIGVISPDTTARVDFYEYLEDNYGADFLQKLAAQRPRIYPSALPIAAALTSGEIAAGIFVEPLTDEQKAGAPVDWRLTKQAWGNPFYAMMLRSAPHPNAAQVLANFLVTPKGQTAISRNAASVLPDIPGAVGTTATVRKQDLTRLTPDKVQEFRSDWEKLFGH